ncbi:probable glutamate receptor [Argiope bruennichi]|uniref:probable glutamate receptor n=1 Tax=Argiope bruennichi TaxID=94029 RepID=UPI00249538CE|nr:probable glutamate receptor [Argiope bruennichi]
MTVYRIRYAPWVPFVDPVLGKDNKFHLGGYAKDAYDGMKMFMDFDYHAEIQPDNVYGAKVNGTWSGMIGSIVANESDISGPFFIDEDRSLAVEFSVPLAFSQMTIVSGMVSSNRNPFMILAVYSIPVWIILFVTTLAISAAASLIYKTLPAPEKRAVPEIYSKYLWAFQTGLIGKGFGENKRWFLKHVWSSPSFRLLQCLWFIAVCVIFMYTYQGAVISAFAADKLKPRISTIEELLEDKKMGISTVNNAYPMALFKRLANTSYESIWFRMENSLENLPGKGIIPGWLDAVEEEYHR